MAGEKQREEQLKVEKEKRLKEYNEGMVFQNNKKVAGASDQAGAWDIDAITKEDDNTKPSFLPSISANDNSTISLKKKKKAPPKIFDLTEQLRALEDEKEKLQMERATIVSMAESKSSYSRGFRKGKKKGKGKGKKK